MKDYELWFSSSFKTRRLWIEPSFIDALSSESWILKYNLSSLRLKKIKLNKKPKTW